MQKELSNTISLTGNCTNWFFSIENKPCTFHKKVLFFMF
jgi:hypothetical protein